ncbi:MAG TPA: hypothetical protein VN426_11890 [Syntrophomonadaceae bacterium]|nr:hypothetical protein [Syntrophomonadaceae bacterium]
MGDNNGLSRRIVPPTQSISYGGQESRQNDEAIKGTGGETVAAL